jgi:hypothetical protein
MSNKLRNLAKSREHLVADAATQRLLLSQNIETLRAPLVLADRGLAAVRYIKSHPIWVAGAGVGVLTIVRPSRIGKRFQSALLVWQVVCRLRCKSSI